MCHYRRWLLLYIIDSGITEVILIPRLRFQSTPSVKIRGCSVYNRMSEMRIEYAGSSSGIWFLYQNTSREPLSESRRFGPVVAPDVGQVGRTIISLSYNMRFRNKCKTIMFAILRADVIYSFPGQRKLRKPHRQPPYPNYRRSWRSFWYGWIIRGTHLHMILPGRQVFRRDILIDMKWTDFVKNACCAGN